jgi:arylsulfatase A-like enzyme
VPRNVVLLVLDTVRADALEPYGAPSGASPAIASLAASGAARDDVFSTACWTLPAHASLFSGQLPRALGLGQAPGGSPVGAKPVLQSQRDRLLPEVLRRAGWETRACSANVWVSAAAGFDTGFDVFEEVETGRRQAELEREDLRGRLAWAREGLRAQADDGAAAAEAVLERWLAEPREKPFFWFVNLVEAHSPYLPPKPYADLGAIERMRAADEARRYLNLSAIWQACLTGAVPPEDALERMRHLYARSVRLADDWVERLLSRLESAGVLDDTLVLVTSDHGENFGEDGLMAHAFSLDDRLINVPFVSSEPVPGAGPLSLADVPALLARQLGLDDHPWDERACPPGLAAAQWDFVAEDDPRVEVASTTWGLSEEQRARLSTPLTRVTDGRATLTARGDRHEGDAELEPGLAHPGLWQTPETEPAPAPEADSDDLERRMKLLGYM